MDMNQPTSHYEYVIDQEKEATEDMVKTRALAYMKTLEGWCSEQKAVMLMDLVLRTHPQKIVEIGVFGGKSLIPMACALHANGEGTIYGIDPWDSFESMQELVDENNKHFWSVVDHRKIFLGLLEKIDQFRLNDYIELIEATSEQAAPISEIDILHVDGNHSEKTSYFDVTKWVPLVRTGGLIIFDDMQWMENGKGTTQKAVRWLDAHCKRFADFDDVSNNWGIWIKK